MFQVPAAFATQTSEWLKELLEEEVSRTSPVRSNKMTDMHSRKRAF